MFSFNIVLKANSKTALNNTADTEAQDAATDQCRAGTEPGQLLIEDSLPTKTAARKNNDVSAPSLIKRKSLAQQMAGDLTPHLKRKSLTATQFVHHDDAEVEMQMLETVGALGEGSFGSVLMMMDRRQPGSYYAVKVLQKERIVKENLQQSVMNERAVMMLLDSDFIVKLYRTCQDRSHLYFIMDPVLGGELFDIYREHQFFGNLANARFYIACISLGLQHMHSKRVIYRDLKLENCLLDSIGYCKLTDMGIAKLVIGKTYTVCGTADYFAPETLRQTGHNRAADWWACGVLLFIMGAGRSPFDAPEVTQIYKNIVKGFSKVEFPPDLPSDYIDTIKSLCRKRPEERVTMQKGGVSNLETMPFFDGFDWDKLASRTAQSPFTPPLTDIAQIRQKKLERQVTINMPEIVDWDGATPIEVSMQESVV
jgi:serine/threonine protein kinase